VASVWPLQGQVPAGQSLFSSDDARLRGAVVSRWPDGSASMVVVSGIADVAPGTRRVLALQARAAGSEPALGADRIGTIVNAVVVDAGALGRAEQRNFGSPERIWWATPEVICARYRAPMAAAGALEAVIDVHAFADGRAFVEVVVENARLQWTAIATPPPQAYATAELLINGTRVATVSGTGAPEGVHAAFRAWYGAGWVGGDPGHQATQSVAELQQHPLLFRPVRSTPSAATLNAFGADTYEPWKAGRHRASNMGGAGDHPSIGALTVWDAVSLQSGDVRAWRSTEAHALAILGFAVNYRHGGTGRVPTFSEIGTRSWQNGNGAWPMRAYNGAMGWEVAHHPATGLMAFAGRPSPVFIELAQKVAVTNGTWGAADTPNWSAGLHGYWYQVRGRAWCLRSLAHATFLTPDGDPWKDAARDALARNLSYLDGWRTDARFVLAGMCDSSPQNPFDHDSAAGFQASMFQFHFMAPELHKLASAKLLSGSAQAAAETLADWCALHQVRWVTEQPDGGWRFIPYRTTVGEGTAAIVSRSTWGAERSRAGNHGGSPASVAGPWMSHSGTPTAYAQYGNAGGIVSYPGQYWAALVAARERNVAGADQAWQTVQSQLTGLAAWLDGFADDPRWGPTPRNL
jgi:hypothetical protein